MLAKKFIIVDDVLVMGMAEYHADLLKEVNTTQKPIGGGRWEWNDNKWPNKLFFFGISENYGSVSEEQFRKAWSNSKIIQ